MATATIDGIETRYELVGEGPPLLMHAPGGFDATIEKWSPKAPETTGMKSTSTRSAVTLTRARP